MYGFRTQAGRRSTLVSLWCVVLVVGSVAMAGTQQTQAAGPAYLVKDIQPPDAPLRPNLLTDVNGTLFFIANDGATGYELWRSDGTAAGTTLVKDINPGPNSSVPQWFTTVNGTLVFIAEDGVHGFELWRSDGTAAGTTLVKDINAGAAGSDPGYLTLVNGVVYFAADNGVDGDELWRSDGTVAGTSLVKNINTRALQSSPSLLTSVTGTLYFTAYTGAIPPVAGTGTGCSTCAPHGHCHTVAALNTRTRIGCARSSGCLPRGRNRTASLFVVRDAKPW